MVFKVSKVRTTPFEGQKSGTSAPYKKLLYIARVDLAAVEISLSMIQYDSVSAISAVETFVPMRQVVV
ncbi:putative phosphoglucomutase [Corchorus olitorius]|uniref:Phosphoglucomutase n=1 Tax=Corchorus olitorius TaxID=93759 RepID=A0A1R3FU22_9ROSI|nr:putative phosphoglucomutase [Corchorus olitorius]